MKSCQRAMLQLELQPICSKVGLVLTQHGSAFGLPFASLLRMLEMQTVRSQCSTQIPQIYNYCSRVPYQAFN